MNYDPTEIAALDILLRDHEHLGPEQSISWMQEHIDQSIDRRFVQRVRERYDKRYNRDADCPLIESCTRDLLVHLSGSLRKYVGYFPSCLPVAPGPKEGDDLSVVLRRHNAYKGGMRARLRELARLLREQGEALKRIG